MQVTGNVSVVVGFVPLPPHAVSDSETVYQNTTNTIDPLTNDWDLDNGILSFVSLFYTFSFFYLFDFCKKP